MKYRIGQRLVEKFILSVDKNYAPDYEITCLGLFGDGSWMYGVQDDAREYDKQVSFYTEEELENEFVVGGEE